MVQQSTEAGNQIMQIHSHKPELLVRELLWNRITKYSKWKQQCTVEGVKPLEANAVPLRLKIKLGEVKYENKRLGASPRSLQRSRIKDNGKPIYAELLTMSLRFMMNRLRFKQRSR